MSSEAEWLTRKTRIDPELRATQPPWTIFPYRQGLDLSSLSRHAVTDFPPLPEQQDIVRRVEALFALADRIEARYAKAKAQADRLTPSLLAKVFRGELVPQDPNDEPASALLERIARRPALH